MPAIVSAGRPVPCCEELTGVTSICLLGNELEAT